MTTIAVSLDEAKYEELTRFAAKRGTEPEALLRGYVDFLTSFASLDDDIPVSSIMLLAELGGSFDWLKDEPDLYSWDDGEPVS